MLKEALQFLINLGNTETKEIEGQIYSTQPIHLVKHATASPLVVRNLSGLVDYLKSDYDSLPPVLAQVESPTEVNVYASFNRDFNRNHFIQAKALLPQIQFERFVSAESFNILLQSCFVPNESRANLLAVVGNIVEEEVANVGDDGVTQKVTAKKGVATVGNVIVPNPVHLKPYRTFVEISQPESQFVFRMRSGPEAALFEADGGAWKLEAIHAIRDFLRKGLDEISDKVTIIA